MFSKYFRITMFAAALAILMVLGFAATAFAAEPPLPDYRQVTLKVWGNGEINADNPKLNLQVLAYDDKGPMAGTINIYGANFNPWQGGLNATGGLTVTLDVTPTVGTFIASVQLGAAKEVTHTVQPGDAWAKYSDAIYGWYYPYFLDSNWDKPLVAGKVITVTVVPVKNDFLFKVVPGEPKGAKLTKSEFVASDQPLVLTWTLADWAGNNIETPEPVTITVGSVFTGTTKGFSTPTAAFSKTGTVPVTVTNAVGNQLFAGNIEIVAGNPYDISISTADPLKAGQHIYFSGHQVDRLGNAVMEVPDSYGYRITGADINVFSNNFGGSYAMLMGTERVLPKVAGPLTVEFWMDDVRGKQIFDIAPGDLTGIELTAPAQATMNSSFTVTALGRDKFNNNVPGDYELSARGAGVSLIMTATFGSEVIVPTNGVTGTIKVSAQVGALGHLVEVEVVEKPTPASAPAAPAAKTHEVKDGDTLWGIWLSLGGESGTGRCWQDWKDGVVKASGLTDSWLLSIGQVLSLPAAP